MLTKIFMKKDLMNAEVIGRKHQEELVNDRLKTKQV